MKTYDVNKVIAALRKRFVNSNMLPITLNMKCNGDVVTVTPCSAVDPITTFDAVEYYLVDSPSLPWLGGDKLETVAKQLAEYELLLEQNAKDKDRLGGMAHWLMSDQAKSKDEWEDVYQTYSDFYKDVYGHRPTNVTRPEKFRS